ncbi:MAG: nucleotidyltransferase family protein [Acidobacteria bacterium]|nr:nucleotidyltransferase family protein [Acidobacteriota bacterium]
MLRSSDFPSPPLVITAEVDELFRLAFAAGGQKVVPEPISLERLNRVSEASALLSRIGWNGRARESWPKTGFLEAAQLAARKVAAGHLIQTHALGVIAKALASDGVEWTALKFAAMALDGSVEPGQRAASDLDILVDPGSLGRATTALETIGFRSRGGRDIEHQTDPLISRDLGVTVELHRKALGVKVPASRVSATQRCLREGGYTVPAATAYPRGHVPIRAVLLAHTIVHGVLHHGFRPVEYPLLRMLGDVIDLTKPGRTLEAVRDAHRYVGHVLAWDVLEEIGRVCEELRASAPVGRLCSHGPSGESRVLKHMIAASLSAEYASSLEFLHARHRLSDHSFLRSRFSVLFQRILITRREAEQVRGRDLSRAEYASLLLRRPVVIWRKLKRSFGPDSRNRAPLVC